MSNVVKIKNKKYVPASDAGELFGYTGDYVSRLAREGKIDGQKLGKQWLVDPRSLESFSVFAAKQKDQRKEVVRNERIRERKGVEMGSTNTQSVKKQTPFREGVVGTFLRQLFLASHRLTSIDSLELRLRAALGAGGVVFTGILLSVLIQTGPVSDSSQALARASFTNSVAFVDGFVRASLGGAQALGTGMVASLESAGTFGNSANLFSAFAGDVWCGVRAFFGSVCATVLVENTDTSSTEEPAPDTSRTASTVAPTRTVERIITTLPAEPAPTYITNITNPITIIREEAPDSSYIVTKELHYVQTDSTYDSFEQGIAAVGEYISSRFSDVGESFTTNLLTVSGNASVLGNLTVAGITSTSTITASSTITAYGRVSAPYFTATSSTATSTFAGGFAVATSGLVYDWNTGYVGIGTTTPDATLSVDGDLTVTGTVSLTGLALSSYLSAPYIQTTDSSASSTFAGLLRAPHLSISSTTATSTFAGGFAVDTNGLVYNWSTNRVGIGTTTPDATLAVDGDLTVTGTVSLTGLSLSSYLSAPYIQTTSVTSSSTFAGSINTPYIAVSSTTATSTFAGGFAIDTDGFVYNRASTNVGIGTTTPLSKFAVSGGATIGTNYNIAAPTNGLLVEGNVGIGTTSPGAKLSVAGDIYASGSLTLSNLSASSYVSAPYFQATNATATSTFAGGFAVATSGLVYDWNTGYVGIGTSSPAQKLSVSGNAYITGGFGVGVATTTAGVFQTSGNGWIGGNLTVVGNSTVLGSSTVVGGTTSDTLTINSSINSNLVPDLNAIRDLGSPSFYWDDVYVDTINANNISAASTTISGTQSADFTFNSDNVSVDTEDINLIFYRGTVVPNALITWDSTRDRFDINQPFYIENDSSTTTVVSLDVQSTSGQTADVFRLASSTGSSILSVRPNGRVGIGTTSPSTSLDVYGTDAIRIPVGTTAQRPSTVLTGQIRYNTTTAQFEGYGASAAWQGLGGVIDIDQDTYIAAEESSDEDYLRFYTAGTQRLTITNTGNVGIGTTSPGAKLHTLATTEQLRLGYDASNYASFTVDASGNLTIAPTGTHTTIANASTTALTATMGYFTTATTTSLRVSGATTLESLTASRLLTLDGSKNLSSVSTLTSWIAGTTNQLTVTDDGDGTVTLSLPSELSFTSATSTNFFATSLTAGTFAAGQTGTTTISATGALTAPSLTASDLTSGRVTFATTGGQLTDSSSFLFDSTLSRLTTTNASTTNLTVGTLLRPTTDDSAPLGASGLAFSDLFLASGGVINWNAGDVTQTHEADTLTFAGASSGYIFSDGNVGIGTTTPSRLLHVVGSGQVGYFGTMNDGLAFQDNSGVGEILGINSANNAYNPIQITTGASPSMYFDTAGKIGIGTTNPQDTLHVLGANLPLATTDTANFVVGTSNSGGDDLGGSIGFGHNGATGALLATIKAGRESGGTNTGYLAFATRNDSVFSTERLRITSAGLVGIGTTSPAYKLDVAGNIGLSAGAGSAGSVYLQARNTGNLTQFGTESSSGNSILSGGTAYASVFGSNGAYPVQFGTSNSVRMTIDSSGTVGVGLTPYGTSNAILGVKQTINNTSGGFAVQANGDTTAARFGAFDGGDIYIASDDGSTRTLRMRMDTNGQASFAGGTSAFDTTGAAAGLQLHYVTSSGLATIGTYSGGGTTNLAFHTNSSAGASTQKMYISGSGLVGIGKTPSTELLEVAGAIRSESSSANFSGGNPGLLIDYTGSIARLMQVNGAAGSAVPLTFGNGNTEYMRLNTSGQLRIGTSDTSTATGKLRVRSTSGTTAPIGRFEAAIGSYTGTTLIAENTLAAASTFNLFEAATDSDGDAGGRTTEFVIRGDGFVGIGGTTPAAGELLNVQGGGYFTSSLYAPIFLDQNNGTYHLDPANTGTSMVVAGKVGIGTTTPAARLNVWSGGTSAAAYFSHTGSASAGGIRIGDPNTISNDTGIYLRSSGTATIGAAGGDLVFDTNFGSSPRMTILHPSGNVGIGTTGPVSALSVTGTSAVQPTISGVHIGQFSGRAAIELVGTSPGGLGGFIDFHDAQNDGDFDYRLDMTAGNLRFLSTNNSAVATTSAYEILTLGPSGNVGIGTTDPTQSLDVASGGVVIRGGAASGLTSAAVMSLYYDTGNDQSVISSLHNATAWKPLVVRSAGLNFQTSSDVEAMRITNTGNVGIGTTTPQGKLDIFTGSPGSYTAYSDTDELVLRGSGNTGLSIVAPDASNAGITFGSPTLQVGTQFIFNHDSGRMLYDIQKTGGYHAFTNQLNELMRITSAGNVGIGSTDPDRKLDILDASNPQLRLTQTDGSIFTDMQVAASTGDLTINLQPNTTAKNIILSQSGGTTGANLRVCEGTACPSVTINNGGNVLVENGYWFGNGFRIDQVAGTTTEIAIYGVTASTTPIIIFDEFN